MKFLKRSNKLYLSSYDLDHIFSALKYQKATKKEILENFKFELIDIKGLSKNLIEGNIKIPKHRKYELIFNEFDNFNHLYNFMEKHRNDKFIIPYYGDDI